MNERERDALRNLLDSGSLSPRQRLEAYRALDGKVEDITPLMQSIRLNAATQGKSLAELAEARRGIDRDAFDYKTGAGSGLRALVSFGETQGDKEAILESLVGKDGYTKDPGGRLALTPKGQAERGMEPSDKNLVLEDEDFSFGDIADITGSLPEIAGSVVGGILAAPLGFIGSAAGSGVGGALGQAVEEGVEGLLGVQTQTLGEVAKDVAIEGAIGASADLVGGAIFNVAKGVAGVGSRVGSRLGRPSIEAGEEQLQRAEQLMERGFIPSLEAAGAPAPLAYAQKFLENASKSTKRIDQNRNTALQIKEQFLADVGADPLSELSESIQFLAPGQLAKLEKANKEASAAYLRAVDESINLLRGSVDDGIPLNNAIIDQITGSFDDFMEQTRVRYAAVDNVLAEFEAPVVLRNGRQVMKSGGRLPVFDTSPLKATLDDILERQGSRTLMDPVVNDAYTIVGDFGKNASFENLVSLRKFLTDNFYFNMNMSTKGHKDVDSLLGIVNDMLDDVNILDNVTGLNASQRMKMAKASELLKGAHADFKKGMKRFDELSQLNIVRNIKEMRDEPSRFVDQFFQNVVKNDQPNRLRAVLNATDNPEQLRDMLARKYLDDALTQSGRTFDDPSKFDGLKFHNQISKLGETGRELFGEDWSRVQKLSRSLAYNGQRKIDRDILDSIKAQGPDQGIITALERINEAKINLDEALSSKVAREISEGTITPEDAARRLVSPSVSDSEVVRIMRSFEGTPEIKENLRKYVLDDVLKSVDVDVFANKQKANSLKNVVDSYKPGVLKRVLGSETYEGLKTFADDLAALSDLSKEGSVAAAGLTARIFTHPIAALFQLGRLRVMSKMFDNPETVRRYIAIRRRLADTPEGRGESILSIMNEVAAEEGVNISRLGNTARKIASQVDLASRVGRQSLARGIAGVTETQERPEPAPSMFSDVDVFGTTGMPVAPQRRAPQAPQAPLSPIQAIRQTAQQKMLRQRAAENPALAATLLGGLGSAALLNR